MLPVIRSLLRASPKADKRREVSHLIAGLGNPGPKYRAHRHNVGYMVVESFSESCESGRFQKKFKGQIRKTRMADHEVILLKPLTFMNLSGDSVQQALHFFNVPLSRLIVVHDELDLDFGVTRIKVGGGTAGHNGLKSIVERCGGKDFLRLRIGIGRPPRSSAEQYVLSDFDEEERKMLPDVLSNAAAALSLIVTESVEAAMNKCNSRGRQGRASS